MYRPQTQNKQNDKTFASENNNEKKCVEIYITKGNITREETMQITER